MNVGEWAAVIAVGLTTAGGICAGVVHSNKTAFQFGQHSERLKQAEDRIRDLEMAERAGQIERTQIALLTQAIEAVNLRLKNFEIDIKNLLTGKIGPPRRPGGN